MATEMQLLEASPRSNPPPSRSGSYAYAGVDSAASGDPKYTSLKDILLDSPTRASVAGAGISAAGGGDGFDSSAICIKNQLLKRAASAYVQSAAVHATRNQSCLFRLWRGERGRRRRHQRPSSSAAAPAWPHCEPDPFEACIGFAARWVRRALTCFTAHLAAVWAWAGRARAAAA